MSSGNGSTEFASKKDVLHLAELIIIGMLVQLLVVGYVFYQSYQGRADLVDSQRGGCERGKLDRKDNAKAWRIAQKRALSQGQVLYSIQYSHVAARLEKRSRINCDHEFPKAGLLP